MITLYLARHGQTVENIARIFQGHMPGTLTVEGIAQAEALRDTLRNISLDAVVSSDLKRCVDTARIAVEGRNLPWEKTVLLREIISSIHLYLPKNIYIDYINNTLGFQQNIVNKLFVCYNSSKE